MNELVRDLKNRGVLKSSQIIEAFLKMDRRDFVPEELRNLAYADEALPIGEGQTISQPCTVAFMLELLEPKKREKIMDVGYGSGWTTALLAVIVGEEGKIFSFERVKELCNFGEENLKKYPELSGRLNLFCKDASEGIAGEKFDAIMASAELKAVPKEWREELKIGGRLVYPKDFSLFKETKKSENGFNVEKHSGFSFVPFIGGGK